MPHGGRGDEAWGGLRRADSFWSKQRHRKLFENNSIAQKQTKKLYSSRVSIEVIEGFQLVSPNFRRILGLIHPRWSVAY